MHRVSRGVSNPIAFIHLLSFLTIVSSSKASPPFLSSYIGSSVTHLFRAMTQSKSRPDKVRCSNHLQSHEAFFLSPLVSTLLFPRIGGVLSHQNFSTQQGLLSISGRTCAFLSSSLLHLSPLMQLRPLHSVKHLSHWNKQNLELFMQLLLSFDPGHLSSHSTLSSSGLLAPLVLWQLHLMISSPGLGQLLRLYGLCYAPISLKGSGNNTNTKT